MSVTGPEHVLRHWSSPDDRPIEIVDAEGAYVYDESGNQYLDFISQLYCVNAGHGNRSIIEAMGTQLDRVQYVSSAKHNDTRSNLASAIAEVAPDGLSSVYFAVSGSEANETAVQLAREYTNGQTILTRWRSYHGGTLATGGLTGDPAMRAPLERHAAATGATKFLPPIAYRSPFDADTPEALAAEAADHLEFVIRNQGPDSVAAILTEPVAGTSGAYTAPPGYFTRVRELCDTYDILLISDEVISGFGRCGDWFGIQTEGVEPDMITFAKGVTSAYAPLAGVIANEALTDFVRSSDTYLGQTFGGHPVACAAGLAAIEEYRGGLFANVEELAPILEDRLRTLDRHDPVGDVRGRGFLWAIEFTDPETGEPYVDPRTSDAPNPVDDVIGEARDRGLLLGSGRPGFQIVIAPPFCIEKATIEEAVESLDAAITAVFG